MSESGNGHKTLVKKLAEVMAAVERVPKRGRNDFHGYDYATEADIAATIRQELAQRHVMLIPGAVDQTRVGVGDKGQVLTTLKMTFTFFDGETGESIERPWFGAGTDKEDKGLYKAFTGAEKYFLLKTFLMPTGDDPEREDAKPPRRAERVERTEREPATPQGATKIADVTHKTGTSKTTGKPWQQWTVEFEDGRKASTFRQEIAGLAQRIHAAGVLVTPVIESPDGRNQNLMGLETDGEVPTSEEPPFAYQAPDNGGGSLAVGGPTEADRAPLMKRVKALEVERRLTPDEKKELGRTIIGAGFSLATAPIPNLVSFVEFLEQPEAVAAWRQAQAKGAA